LAEAREIELDRRVLLGSGPDAAAPQPAEIDAFDVVVIGDLAAAQLPAATVSRLAERVRTGGAGVLTLGGRQAYGPGGWAATPLAEVLPFAISAADSQVKGPLALVPTAAGRRHFILSDETGGGADPFAVLPPLAGANAVGTLHPAGRVLAEAPGGQPLLAVREFGRGRAAALTVDTTWTWVLSEKDPQGPEHHRRFWRQLILWLAGRDGRPKDDVWVVTDRLRYVLTDGAAPPTVQAVVHVPPAAGSGKGPGSAAPSLRVTAPDGSAEQVPLKAAASPGDWRSVLRPSRAGAYTLAVEGTGPAGKKAETQVVVEEQDLEMADILADHENLKRIARAGGGTFRTLDGLGGLIREIAAGLEPMYEPTERRVPLASGPIFLAAVIGLLALEWFLRRRWGMV
jgi:uncharacterized membrane protein